MPHFDEEGIRAEIAADLDTTKGCHVEILMKDTHTVLNEPNRLIRWVQIVREEIEKRY